MSDERLEQEGGYLLREVVASKRLRRPIYFQRMTGIGPMTTAKRSEATVFSTKEAATLSPAMRFLLTIFVVEPI